LQLSSCVSFTFYMTPFLSQAFLFTSHKVINRIPTKKLTSLTFIIQILSDVSVFDIGFLFFCLEFTTTPTVYLFPIIDILSRTAFIITETR
jgi:hypothetical protein